MNWPVYIITIAGCPESVAMAQRCAESAQRVGLEANMVPAVTPGDDPRAIFARKGWPVAAFDRNRYSRPLPCMACFASHAELWERCVIEHRAFIVCEHDAVFVRPLPNLGGPTGWLVNLGRPSFGKFRQPPPGLGPLVSKPHLPGAHGYFLRPMAAAELLAAAKREACPTDVFLSLERFRFIREAYPWPVECHEEFTTIQAAAGCAAKHRPVRII